MKITTSSLYNLNSYVYGLKTPPIQPNQKNQVPPAQSAKQAYTNKVKATVQAFNSDDKDKKKKH